MGIYAFAETRE